MTKQVFADCVTVPVNTIYDHAKYNDKGLFEKQPLQRLLDELDTIELSESPEHGRLLGEVTSKQLDIYEPPSVKPSSL